MAKKINLKEQLQYRVDALQQLLDEGLPLPANAKPPTSMAQAREWENSELGIEAIASKSSTNLNNFKEKLDILLLLQDLTKLIDRCEVLEKSKKRAPAPKPETETSRLSKENAAYKIREEGLANRLHEVEHQLLTLMERFENQRLQLSKQDELVIELRRQLNSLLKSSRNRANLSLATNEDNKPLPSVP